MNTERNVRRRQLEALNKAIAGKERIIETWRRVCKPAERCPLPFPEMIEQILNTEFPPVPR